MQNLFGDVDKREFMNALKSGESMDCPCCGRFAKVYKRRMHHGIARALIRLFMASAQNPKEYLHFTAFCDSITGCDFTIARHWGLIEDAAQDDDEKKTSGLWRLTTAGRDYVAGRSTLPKYVLLYNDETLGFEGQHITINDCIGDKFNYREMMDGVFLKAV